MPKRKIVIEPDPILRRKSSLIENVDDQVRKLMDDMLLTMYEAPGIGLAAVQVGILKRVIVIDISKDDQKKNQYSWLIQKSHINRKKLQFMRKVAYLYLDTLLK